ncbi:helix-hairpin-helix domain-containing protein [Curtobacterium aurantiacum]|uniref:Helix-hairpin-helix domain-containing protein n=1 Tax=Curtobacterium aurantiacum TaxID=3236919 RepID=A0ABS5VKD9_9MICO|nr:helix-hairpin-helix domain-containing protein [Curtobacterium flaccumfaciens]MBT1544934.1 helix-hairpin-helix domain-containing protein [Curtobacterium flaccumfaciens pv. flaccumfaciens]MBT1588482.1 helix-hairpin-helix domain-containing protein [Curtobacterium flaccumfaciens pv. flaccumfaciens]
MSSPSSPGPWWSRLVLSPRAAVVLAAVVVVVAVVVVLVGALAPRGDEGTLGSGGAVVRGAPTAGAGGVSGAPSSPPSGGATGPGAGTGASSAPDAGRVLVHVLGAVRRDGVVELPATSRVGDAIDRAGGATDDADLDRMNLARVLMDGERLYVPRVGQQEVPDALGPVTGGDTTGSPANGAGAGGAASGADAAVVDLNTADLTALETLPGIGPGLAGRIIAWRDEHGRFTSIEDLLDVSGIGDLRFAELRDRVRV